MSPIPVDSRWGGVAAVLGLLAVAAGAFGAHGLEQSLEPEDLERWAIGSRYLAIHSLALLATAILSPGRQGRHIRVAPWAFSLGMLLFSGGLWVYALTGIKFFAWVTPFGGLSMMTGWGCLAVGLFRS
jgi:uncharacterized membrane protein YgdD (TMEM256/DUF423 family)